MTSEQPKKVKSKTGAPSKYNEQYCEMLIKHMAEGLSYESFAGLIGVSIRTLYDWEIRYKAFAQAKEIAFPKSLLWWENLGRAMAAGKLTIGKDNNKKHVPGNPAVFIFTVRNRFPKQYSEAAKVELTVKNPHEYLMQIIEKRKQEQQRLNEPFIDVDIDDQSLERDFVE